MIVPLITPIYKSTVETETENMSVLDLTALLQIHKDTILNGTFTKSDFSYHNTKQSLHNMWAKIYPMDKSQYRTMLTKSILECLFDLDKKAETNEGKKYQKYYASSAGIMKDKRSPPKIGA
ncbi:hypothetical protein JTB14_032162 [Gonioctena quinquepunctata]|nr:hypothetical protein JTB14_032162 [Gonioctena quinquepunctata]